MSFHRCCRLLILALILVPALMSLSAVAAEPALPQYLLFQIFLGGPERQTGVFQRGRSNAEILRIVRQIAETGPLVASISVSAGLSALTRNTPLSVATNAWFLLSTARICRPLRETFAVAGTANSVNFPPA